MKVKIVISIFCACLIMGLCGINASAENKREEPLATLFSASDFQNPDSHEAGAIELERIIQQVLLDGKKNITGALICGDYNAGDDLSEELTTMGVETIKSILEESWDLSHDEIYFLQGNHDPSDAPNIDLTGGTDQECYSVYQINHQDFGMLVQDYINEEELIIDASKDLKKWLNRKIEENYTNPVFVISHLPLHNSYRYDNLYSEHLFDVLNCAGEQGLNIFYLFGHNHGKEYDNYLGGDVVYLSKGDSINIPDIRGNGSDDYKTEKLAFTYLNAGYLSKPQEDVLSSCIFEIYEDRVEITRYSNDGIINLKNKGISSSKDNGWSADEREIKSPQIIKLNDHLLTIKDKDEFVGKITLDIGESRKITINTGDAEPDYKWECTNPKVVSLKNNDQNEILITGENYGTTDIYFKQGDLKTKVSISVMPENAFEISYQDNLRFYKLVKDISVELNEQSNELKEYIILNKNTQGVANAFAVQDDEMVAIEPMRVVYVPGVGKVTTPEHRKHLLWSFEKIEETSKEISQYSLRMSKKSPYRYGYYISPTKDVDTMLETHNLNKMRLYNSDMVNAAIFSIDENAENGLNLITESYYNDGVRENENGKYVLNYDELNEQYMLDNSSVGKKIYFYKKTDDIISNIIFWTDAENGTAYVDSDKTTETGGMITVIQGDIVEEVPITLGMLSGYDQATAGIFKCNVSFNGEIISEEYELTIEKNHNMLVQWLLNLKEWIYQLVF